MITPGRLWYLLRRDVRRGWAASRHHYQTLGRIQDWQRPFWSSQMRSIPVHMLTGKNDWELAAWMLASWFHYSESSWPVTIHDDGTLPASASETLKRMFPDVRVISRAEGDAAMELVLKQYPFCYEYRAMHPLALKIFDMAHFAGGNRLMIFDSDLLFFNFPREIVDWAERENEECWFNEDVAEGSLVSAKDAQEELGVALWPKVNSGLCLIHKPAIDYEFCDRALAETAMLRGHIWRVEQTLFALCASRHGKGGLLPKRYEVSLRKHGARDAVTRHYVGAVRERFYGEGLGRLSPVLLAQ